jgi:predicted ArsR family transcriptional regulator
VADDFEAQVAGVAALNDPIRRALYRAVAASATPLSRDQAAAEVGIGRSLAAFHLDKLAEEGLLDVEFRRLTGRSGPGAGRPAKLYRRSPRQIELSLPPRQYDLAGTLLATAVEAAVAAGGPASTVHEELRQASSRAGRAIGEQAAARAGPTPSPAGQRAALVEVLREHGFEPRLVGDDIVLSNCPFHVLAEQFTELVCGMNLHLLEGVRSALEVAEGHLEPRLEPEPGQCCVKFCSAA